MLLDPLIDLHLYFGHATVSNWIEATSDFSKSTTEAKLLLTVLSDYRVKGLILKRLNYVCNDVRTNLFRL